MLKNINYSILLSLIGISAPLITLPIALHALGPNQYGTYAHAAVISNWLIAIFVNSLNAFQSREYALKTESPYQDKHRTFVKLFSLQFLLAVAATLIHLLVILALSESKSLHIYMTFTIATIFSAFNVDWYFYCKNKLKTLFWRTLFIRLISIALILTLIKTPNDTFLYCSIIVGASAISNLASFLYVTKTNPPTITLDITHEIKSAKHFFANAGVGSIYQFADQFMLGLLSSKADVAYLSLCKQILSALNVLPSAVCRALMPLSTVTAKSFEFSNYINKLIIKLGISALLIATIFSLAGPYPTRLLAGENYHFPSFVFPILGGCFLVIALNVFIDTQISIPMELEYITTRANFAAAIAMPGAIFILLPYYGYIGALLALLIGESSGLFTMIWCHRKFGLYKK